VKEVVSKRTATSKTFDLGGGKFRLEAGGHAHHGPPGAMVETSRAFIDDPTEFRSGQHPCDVGLPKNYAQPMRFGHGRDTVIVRPLDFKTPPARIFLENDVVTYAQAYDGIDVLYRLTNTGLKAVYRITSEAGQRKISFEVSGEFDKYHQAPFWMDESESIPQRVDVPFSADGSTRTYDFTSVPVGTDVDPTFAPAADDDCVSRRQDAVNPGYVVGDTDAAWGSVYSGGTDYTKLGIAFRLIDVTIPQGVTIDSCTANLEANASTAGTTVYAYISCEDVDSAASFTGVDASAFDVRAANNTTARTSWTTPPFTAGTKYDSPDFASSLQEVVSRGGFTSGSDVVVFIDDFDGRTSTGIANTYRNVAFYAHVTRQEPQVTVEYTVAGGWYPVPYLWHTEG